MSTGGGATALSSALLNITGMPKSIFIVNERLIGDNLQELSIEKMAEAG